MEAPAMLLCFAIIMINAEGQTQLLDISINKTQLGGRKLEARTHPTVALQCANN